MLQFWFEFASTYSYLAASRLTRAAAARGVDVDWCPFLLGPIFAEMGWRDSPFNIYEAKGVYMWHDVARQAERYGVPFRRPSAFPRNGLLAARIAVVAREEGWIADFVPAVYRANFFDDRDIGERETLADILVALDRNPEKTLARANEPEIKAVLRENVEKARGLGIFGAPTFVVGGELFWGDDRLDLALEKAAN